MWHPKLQVYKALLTSRPFHEPPLYKLLKLKQVTKNILLSHTNGTFTWIHLFRWTQLSEQMAELGERKKVLFLLYSSVSSRKQHSYFKSATSIIWTQDLPGSAHPCTPATGPRLSEEGAASSGSVFRATSGEELIRADAREIANLLMSRSSLTKDWETGETTLKFKENQGEDPPPKHVLFKAKETYKEWPHVRTN